MIRKASEIQLKVLPVLFGMEHLYYYEGPCRLVDGEALQPGFDKIGNEMFWKGFLDNIQRYMPAGVEVLEPVRACRTDDWDNKEAMWETLAQAAAGADVAFLFSNLGVDDLAIEFGLRFAVPIVVCPTSSYSPTQVFSALKTLSKFFIVMAMAAIGMNTDVVKLVRTGGRPILLGFTCWVCITLVSLGMQHLLGIW